MTNTGWSSKGFIDKRQVHHEIDGPERVGRTGWAPGEFIEQRPKTWGLVMEEPLFPMAVQHSGQS